LLMLDVVSYNSAISACEKGTQCQIALALLQEMVHQSLLLHVVSFNAAMSACGESGQWMEALTLLEGMPAMQVKPSVISYSTAASACEKQGRWQQALGLLADMEKQGLTLDAACKGMTSRLRKHCAGRAHAAEDDASPPGVAAQAAAAAGEAAAAAAAPSAPCRPWADALQKLEHLSGANELGISASAPEASSQRRVDRAESAASSVGSPVRELLSVHPKSRSGSTVSESHRRGEHVGDSERSRTRSCGPKEWLKLVEENANPCLSTFRQAISACAGGGHWAEALQLLERAWEVGCDPGERVCRAAADACVAADQRDVAHCILEIVREIQEEPLR